MACGWSFQGLRSWRSESGLIFGEVKGGVGVLGLRFQFVL